jgi:hypothetical protein
MLIGSLGSIHLCLLLVRPWLSLTFDLTLDLNEAE